MKLSHLLTVDRILPEMKATDHRDAIIELVNFLTENLLLPPSLRDESLAALEAREKLISTGVGYGVAIPHAFSDSIDNVTAVLGRSINGIDFHSLDDAPVHFVILFIVPKKDYHLHLRTLAAIAKMFTNAEIRRKLAQAESSEQILAILNPRLAKNGNHKPSLNPSP